MSPALPASYDCGITVPRQDKAEDCWAAVAKVFELFGVTGIGPDLPLSAVTLRDEMEAGRPVMWGYQWDRGGGHVALVTGWRSWTGRFLIQDPYFGPGELNYGEIMAAYGIGRAVVCWGRFALKEKRQ